VNKNLLFNKKKKIILSPHYDDFTLSLGGIALEWGKKGCLIEDWIIFSNSNYLVNDHIGNKDISENRINVVSSIRLKEEQNAIKRIGNVKLKLLHQDEALIRGHDEKEHPDGFPYGFDKRKDEAVIKNICKLLWPLLSKDIQIFVPFAIQEHIDHFIVRQIIAAKMRSNKRCQIFFYEDLPYAAYATKKEWKNVSNFVKKNNLLPIIIPINLKLKTELLDFYNSQTNKYCYKGTKKRANEIKGGKIFCEKIYFLLK